MSAANALSMRTCCTLTVASILAVLAACTTVGPDFEPLSPGDDGALTFAEVDGLEPAAEVPVHWWEIFDDPVLNRFVDEARAQNLNVEIAALRVLEARARLDIAAGLRYPQTQVAGGDASFVSPSESELLDLLGIDDFWQYSLGATVAWEADFWGRYRRGVEAAGASLEASIAAWDQAIVLLTAQVVSAYTTVREIEEQLRISSENVTLQRRSYEITQVRFRNGQDSELDMQQALSLLLGTQATIPPLEAALQRTKNALSALLGRPPGYVDPILAQGAGLPVVSEDLAVGLPADMLRRRPDVRQAELLAKAQNAAVGLATADLYPSFQLTGSLASTAGGPADTPLSDLLSSGSFAYAIGGNFVWPFLNYGRIRSNIRVEDARLQQALLNYRNTVIMAAREADDAVAELIGARAQNEILAQAVQSASRSNQLSLVRYREGFSDYERVLDSQQRLFTQQQRYVTNLAAIVQNTVDLYKALGGGWEDRQGMPTIDEENVEMMRARSDWGELLSENED
ncbi:MAG: efflux transporter outer membrane subunit [Gammaproteobacteria bacterium]|jgi:NodT family efflux transporter outer membrane factor (OMF) lipoprotein